jgi:hypothetical protein
MVPPNDLKPVRRSERWKRRGDVSPVERLWCWPVPRLAGRDPIAVRAVDATHRHAVDLGYSEAEFESLLFVPVYAAQDGIVRLAIGGPSGYAVSIDHDGEWLTHYTHLRRMFVKPQTGTRRRRFEPVRAGNVLGYAAQSPVHVRFALWTWNAERGYVPVDPLPHLRDWGVQTMTQYFEPPCDTPFVPPVERAPLRRWP